MLLGSQIDLPRRDKCITQPSTRREARAYSKARRRLIRSLAESAPESGRWKSMLRTSKDDHTHGCNSRWVSKNTALKHHFLSSCGLLMQPSQLNNAARNLCPSSAQFQNSKEKNGFSLWVVLFYLWVQNIKFKISSFQVCRPWESGLLCAFILFYWGWGFLGNVRRNFTSPYLEEKKKKRDEKGKRGGGQFEG